LKVLITGITGALARQVARRLLVQKHKVIGIDRRAWPDSPKGIRVHEADIRKRPAEDVFRLTKPDAVIHMATVTHFTVRHEERFRINLGGTRTVFEHCHTYGVKQAVFVGRHTIYGAAADAPLYRNESEPPLAAATFPELADLVAADLFAGAALWRWPDLSTAVLRLVYTLGPSRRGNLAAYIRGPRVPTVLGFDPLFHLMHESDAANAIVATVEHGLRGVFNVAGPQPVPLSILCRATGRTPIPIPEPLIGMAFGRFGFPRLPRDVVPHLKHPIVIDGSAFREAAGFEHQFDEIQAMESYRFG